LSGFHLARLDWYFPPRRRLARTNWPDDGRGASRKFWPARNVTLSRTVAAVICRTWPPVHHEIIFGLHGFMAKCLSSSVIPISWGAWPRKTVGSLQGAWWLSPPSNILGSVACGAMRAWRERQSDREVTNEKCLAKMSHTRPSSLCHTGSLLLLDFFREENWVSTDQMQVCDA